MAEEKAKVEETSKDLPSLSKNAEKVLEIVDGMTVLELADLVKVMEDKYGVSAAAPVAVAGAAPAADAAPEEEEKAIYDIELSKVGDDKIAAIKAIREITELGLMEAKQIVDGTLPAVIKEGVPKEQAE
ncbi:50S ribosomal protein L7/L12, partial [Candidatus Dojkabacteria bacterium]|nr:50S ribosomal protein L7/L12 [Candidatus Dojkabacteria bacterium]